uniref:Uncharacterized protein n=1 Tax=Arundo donax TaxID=35708 RepID=A0A0A9A173_ARUDO
MFLLVCPYLSCSAISRVIPSLYHATHVIENPKILQAHN